MDCTINVAKTKALISCMVTAHMRLLHSQAAALFSHMQKAVLLMRNSIERPSYLKLICS